MGDGLSVLKNHTRMHPISLITDRTCGTNIETQYLVDFSCFTELQSLTWRGLSRFDDLESVGKCIIA